MLRNYTYLAVYAKVSWYYEIVTTNKQSWAVYAFHNHIGVQDPEDAAVY